jgi:hypothetical protein
MRFVAFNAIQTLILLPGGLNRFTFNSRNGENRDSKREFYATHNGTNPPLSSQLAKRQLSRGRACVLKPPHARPIHREKLVRPSSWPVQHIHAGHFTVPEGHSTLVDHRYSRATIFRLMAKNKEDPDAYEFRGSSFQNSHDVPDTTGHTSGLMVINCPPFFF